MLALSVLASCSSEKPSAIPLPTAPQQELSKAPEIPVDETDYQKLFDDAFAKAKMLGEKDLSYEIKDGAATILKYSGSETAIAIPHTLDGAEVTSIADGAFSELAELEVIYIPPTVQSLGKGILKGCDSLQAISTPLLGATPGSEGYLGYLFGGSSYMDNGRDVPDTLTLLELGGIRESVPNFAFFECNDLLAVRLSGVIKTIGKYAFYQCSNLKYLDFDRYHLLSIEEHALDSCVSFTELNLGNAKSIGLGALEGCSGLYRLTLPFVGGSADENNYLAYVFGADVPDFAKGYYPPRLQEVIVTAGCKSLGNYAFFECETLRRVTLPEGLEEIGVRAFADCDALTEIKLPASLASIRENAFVDCDYLTDVVFEGEELETIGVNAFYNCVSIKEIKLSASLATLPASCFANCVSLETVEMKGVKKVEKNAFRNCPALVSANAADGVEYED
jgi:hypothetical protein